MDDQVILFVSFCRTSLLENYRHHLAQQLEASMSCSKCAEEHYVQAQEWKGAVQTCQRKVRAGR